MPFDDRELLARLIKCEAGGEGEDGMNAVASVVLNRARAEEGEFARISNGGDIRKIIRQPGQFTCLKETVNGEYNPQNVYNMDPEEIHYRIADWVLAGNSTPAVDHSLFFFNPYSADCPQYFPQKGIGVFYSRVNNHCFYAPGELYKQT